MSGNDLLYAGEACRFLIKTLSKPFGSGSIEWEYTVDIISCLVSGDPLPDGYRKCLTSEIQYQQEDENMEKSHPSTHCSISQVNFCRSRKFWGTGN